MLIGNRYADNKLYRGIRHYDSLPLTSGDLHEYADILQMKNAFFMNNLLGSGILNEPDISVSSTGASLVSPSILLLDGDISLIQSDDEILKVSDINSSGIQDGVLCIVGWYQSLTASSTLRSYGGVNNSVLENDIMDTKLNIQVSTRYQLRWDTILLEKSVLNDEDPITFNLINRDATGEISSGSIQITTYAKEGNVRIATKPSSMDYAVSDLYIIPILQYTYADSNLSSVRAIKSLKPEGTSGLINTNIEPTDDIDEGTIWYNPDTQKFRFYVEGVGFVPTASDITLMQYHNTIFVSSEVTTPTNITVEIGITSYTEDDILQVMYEGLVLTENIHYTISSDRKSITLNDFTTNVGDKITFVVIKLVDTSTINSFANEFSTHVNEIGNSTTKGHLSLSDTLSPTSGSSNGVAATPKLVYDATTIIDSTTNKKYRLTVTNGVLGVTEII